MAHYAEGSRMSWYRVVSATPINVDYENGSVVSYPRNSIFQADPQLRDIRLAMRGRRKLFPLGATLPDNFTNVAIKAPGPSTKPPAKIEQKNKKGMPRVSYRGSTYQIADIIS
jgi:hypothetical protein